MDLNSIYLPVEKILVDQIMPGYNHPSGIKNAVIVTQPNGEKLIANYCSDKYFLVKNEDVIEPFKKELEKVYNVGFAIKVFGYTQFHVDFNLLQFGTKILKNDEIFPRIRLSNSYDGRVRYHFTMGFFRQVCTNGLTAPVGDELKIRKLHTPSLENLTSFEKVLEMASNFLKSSDKFFGTYFELLDNPVRNLNYRIEDVIEDTGFPPSLEEDVKSRVSEEMSQLGLSEPNDWLVYNAFNYQLNHNENYKAKQEKKEEIDVEILNYLLQY